MVSSPEGTEPGPDAEFARRLARLHRTLTESLVAADPLTTLLRRLKTNCNATVAIVDRHGDVTHATGVTPLAGAFELFAGTTDETRTIEFEGWRGVVGRLREADDLQSHVGWLVVLARRSTFPDLYEAAAVQLGTALVETCQRIGTIARQQELAIRAAVLEEMLAFRPVRQDATLIGRAASLGLDLTDEVRVAAIRPAGSTHARRSESLLEVLVEGLRVALGNHPIRHLISVRDGDVVVAFQATTATFKRVVTASNRLSECRIGVGRKVHQVADFGQSLNDAELALQTLRPNRRGVNLLAYEDFDVAMRLFADIGVDQLGVWARRFLAPLLDRPALIEGLHVYFRHGQNMNAAADELHIHHNSLRYRLAKVEQLLAVTLHDPAAISSLFLALRALELERFELAPSPVAIGDRREVSDVAAPHRLGNTDILSPATGPGVARSPRPR